MVPSRDRSRSRAASRAYLRACMEAEAHEFYRNRRVTTASEIMQSPSALSPLQTLQHVGDPPPRYSNPERLSSFDLNPPDYSAPYPESEVDLQSNQSDYTGIRHHIPAPLSQIQPQDDFNLYARGPAAGGRVAADYRVHSHDVTAAHEQYDRRVLAPSPYPSNGSAFSSSSLIDLDEAAPSDGFPVHGSRVSPEDQALESTSSDNNKNGSSTSFMNNSIPGVTPSPAEYLAEGLSGDFSEHHAPESTVFDNNYAFSTSPVNGASAIGPMADGFSVPYSSTQEREPPRYQTRRSDQTTHTDETTYSGSHYSNSISSDGMAIPNLRRRSSACLQSYDSFNRLSELRRHGRQILETEEQEGFERFGTGTLIGYSISIASNSSIASGSMIAPLPIYQPQSNSSRSQPTSLPPPMMVGLEAHPAVLDNKELKKDKKSKGRMGKLTQDRESEGKEKKRGKWLRLFKRKTKGDDGSANNEEGKKSWKWWNPFKSL
ncbi:hypothetical protein N431DRAFT_487935 [Stipitochalara longipes BDJ]|nr:hypothetical protein N431DRAFT_487935 [Stipitochalara longipes BDJ]